MPNSNFNHKHYTSYRTWLFFNHGPHSLSMTSRPLHWSWPRMPSPHATHPRNMSRIYTAYSTRHRTDSTVARASAAFHTIPPFPFKTFEHIMRLLLVRLNLPFVVPFFNLLVFFVCRGRFVAAPCEAFAQTWRGGCCGCERRIGRCRYMVEVVRIEVVHPSGRDRGVGSCGFRGAAQCFAKPIFEGHCFWLLKVIPLTEEWWRLEFCSCSVCWTGTLAK